MEENEYSSEFENNEINVLGEKRKLKKSATAVGFTLVLFEIFIVISQYILSAIIHIFIPDTAVLNKTDSSNLNMIYNSGIQILSLVITTILIFWVYKNKPLSVFKPNNTKLKHITLIFPIVIFLNFITSIIINIIIKVIENNGTKVPVVDFSFDNMEISTLIIYFSSLCIFAPLIEEFILRGLVLNFLKPYGNWFAIMITAIFFGVMHGNIEQAFGATLLGVVFGIVAVKSNSIIPSMILHSLNNLFPFLSTIVFMNEDRKILITCYTIVYLFIIILGLLFLFVCAKELKNVAAVKPTMMLSKRCRYFFINILVLLYIAFAIGWMVIQFFEQ